MTADMFAVYRTATHEVFRLETLQVYSVEDEADQFRTWKATGKVPRDPAIEESTSAYRQAVARGVRVHRVHVLDLPLTPYLAYELAGYQENTAAGEDVRIAVRSRHEELTNLTRDLALIDPGTDHAAVVWFRYDDGVFTSSIIRCRTTSGTRWPATSSRPRLARRSASPIVLRAEISLSWARISGSSTRTQRTRSPC